ncbi:Vasorin-like [Arapaima gigas]
MLKPTYSFSLKIHIFLLSRRSGKADAKRSQSGSCGNVAMKTDFLPLLLLIQQPLALNGACPTGCTCSNSQSVFCLQRLSPSIPRELPRFISYLYLFQNGIETLTSEDFSGFDHLEMLDLSQNKLSELPDGTFELLPNLHNLDLSSNQITHISKDSFSGLNLLERLYLFDNRIESIHPAAFRGLEQLLELKLQKNMLKALPELRLPQLLLLDLSYNRIPPPGLTDLNTPHLESLKLAGLGLASLDEELLSNLGNLRQLDVSHNQLHVVPRAISNARGLTWLNLATNPLGQLRREDLQHLSNLQELNLSDLKLLGFPEGFQDLFPRLTHLTAAKNPFNCVCDLAWLPGWLRSRKVSLGQIKETHCHFPPHNAGKELVILETSDFGCPATTTLPYITTSGTAKQLLLTTLPETTTASPELLPSEKPSIMADSDSLASAQPSPSNTQEDATIAPPCPNGGACQPEQQELSGCVCSLGASESCCQPQEEHVPVAEVPTVTATPNKPDIVVRESTSTTIQLDLHRYVEARPHIRGIRLTYWNLSGPDRRPMLLDLPTSYVKYTLRGLQPNSTYYICATPHGEPSADGQGSCMEASTTISYQSQLSEQPVRERQMTTVLAVTLAAVAVVLLLMIIMGTACYLHRRKGKGHKESDLGDPSPLELEGVKPCLDSGTLLQKHPEILASLAQNGAEYELPLSLEHFRGNNNMATTKPSYF